MKKIILSISVMLVILSACKKKDETTVTPATADYSNGVFVTNEGQFGSGSGTISFYNRSSKTVTADIFQKANSFPLGNVVQSMNVFNDKGYIVVNNAQKIE